MLYEWKTNEKGWECALYPSDAEKIPEKDDLGMMDVPLTRVLLPHARVAPQPGVGAGDCAFAM